MAKADPNVLRRLLSQCPPANSRFRHYKGGEYFVIGAAIQEATLEPVVLYCPAEGDGSDFCWARTLADWNAVVKGGAEGVPRFERIN
jgi:hypothetical protein